MAAVVGAAVTTDFAFNGQLSQRRHLVSHQLRRLADLQWSRGFIGHGGFFGVHLRGLVKQTALRKCGIKWGTLHCMASLVSIVRRSWRDLRIVKQRISIDDESSIYFNGMKNMKKAN